MSGFESNAAVMMAVFRLQRMARRKRALKMAHAEQQWKMFNDLDTQDEAEMLHLAVFMQTLIDCVPDTGDPREGADKLLMQHMGEDDHHDHDDHDGGDDDFDSGPSAKMVRLDSIEVTLSKTASQRYINQDYDIGSKEITSEVAAEIIEVYRNGGKVSRKSVLKILRRAYKTLKAMPNVTRMTLPQGSKLNAVGDLHGQLQDLFYILDEAGLPNKNNKFVFNGDFVDRGQKGLEVVVILFALFVAEGPNVVSLNRGNHEDMRVCRVYGFENEVKAKYDEQMFDMFAEVFNYIPLFTLIEDSIFVVHGGLFHSPEVAVEELDEIDRYDYLVKPPVPYPRCVQGLAAPAARKEYMKQLQRDALWSDPTEENGVYLNPRGAGVSFGPNVAQAFMDYNEIDMVVRSHECVYRGFLLPYSGDQAMAVDVSSKGRSSDAVPPNTPALCTLFSASNYTGGDNEGAFMIFLPHPYENSYPVGKSGRFHYSVKRYKTSAASPDEILNNNNISLRELILKRMGALVSAFVAADTENTGNVTRLEWADIMQRITCIKIRWLSIISSVAPEESLQGPYVAYRKFLDTFSVSNTEQGGKLESKVQIGALDYMYGQRKKLEAIFYSFDTNRDGMITLDEFRDGCERLNANLHPDCQLTDIEHTLEMMDFDKSGTIDINEFFETFRILDAKDGQVDGVLSIADSAKQSMKGDQQKAVLAQHELA